MSGLPQALTARMESLLAALEAAASGDYSAAHQRVAPVDDDFGKLEQSIGGFLRQLSENAATVAKSNAEIEAKVATIERQRQTIQALTIPVLDIWDGVLALPLLGVLDTARAIETSERLLTRVVDIGAKTVIVDLTGVEVVDTSTADHLGRLTRGARLLGADCVLTGIQPAVARTLVSMGIDLTGIQTLRTLRDGLRWSFARKEEEQADSLDIFE